MSEVHLVVPDAVADPRRPSGGNTYDRHLAAGLAGLGWRVSEHLVTGPWPERDPAALDELRTVLDALPRGRHVVVDGLIASVADDVLTEVADRLRIVVLVHLPRAAVTGSGAPDDAVERERRALAAAVRVIVPSAWCRDRLVELHDLDPSDMVVAPPGVDPAPLVRGSAAGDRLLCVGAVTPVKGQDVLLDALVRVADHPWTCTWAGSLDIDPEFSGQLRERLAASPVRDRVHLAGPLEPAALDQAYAATDLLVLPSRVETYGMVVTEALARGIPVVASEVGGVREALGATEPAAGLVVPSEDPDALAESLRRWWREPALRAHLRTGAWRRRGGLPGWDRTARTVAEALTSEPGGNGVRRPGQVL